MSQARAETAVKAEAKFVKKYLIFLALIAGCGSSDDPAGNGSTGISALTNGPGGPAASSAAQPDENRLTGLFESGPQAQRNQLCMVEKTRGNAQFGIVVWGANMHSCSGAGEAVREGQALRLRMAGDSACEIRATIDGGTIRLPDSIPDGCAYYCGARATFAGTSLSRVGSSPADAMKATDLAGDPLCETSATAPG
jgi:hypothetical protein